jgi:UDP-3-O-[3-hydroxymyristoyl] glucosamine N-acyltransferase
MFIPISALVLSVLQECSLEVHRNESHFSDKPFSTLVSEPKGRPIMAINGDVQLGRDVKIFHPHLVNLYGCEIGDQTKIGSFVEIQKNVTVGGRCKDEAST